MTVRLTGRLICASPEEAERVAQHLAAHVALTRDEPGCLAFSVRPTGDPLIWQVDEVFADRAAFDAHQARTRASDWFARIGHIRREFAVTQD